MPIISGGSGGGGAGTVTSVASATSSISVSTPSPNPVLTWVPHAGDYLLTQIAKDTQHALAISGATDMASLPLGAASQHLISQGAGADPAWIGWSNFGDFRNTNTAQTLISQSIPGGTLGTSTAGLLIVVSGVYQNASGSSRGMTLLVSYGGTTLWSDTSTATWFANSANLAGFLLVSVLNNAGGTSTQRVTGSLLIGDQNAGSVAGSGTIQGVPIANTAFSGSSVKDSTLAQTLLITQTNSAQNASLGLVVTSRISVLA